MGTSQRISRGFHRLGLLLAAMPLLAGVYEAYAAANADLEQQQVITWLSAFFNELVLRLPLAFFLAIVVYGLVSVVGAVLLRLHHVSLAAQAARNEIELPRPHIDAEGNKRYQLPPGWTSGPLRHHRTPTATTRGQP